MILCCRQECWQLPKRSSPRSPPITPALSHKYQVWDTFLTGGLRGMQGVGAEQRKTCKDETPYCVENCHLWYECQPKGKCARPSGEEQGRPGQRAGGHRRNGPLFCCSTCPFALVSWPPSSGKLKGLKSLINIHSTNPTSNSRMAKVKRNQEGGTHRGD